MAKGQKRPTFYLKERNYIVGVRKLSSWISGLPRGNWTRQSFQLRRPPNSKHLQTRPKITHRIPSLVLFD